MLLPSHNLQSSGRIRLPASGSGSAILPPDSRPLAVPFPNTGPLLVFQGGGRPPHVIEVNLDALRDCL